MGSSISKKRSNNSDYQAQTTRAANLEDALHKSERLVKWTEAREKDAQAFAAAMSQKASDATESLLIAEAQLDIALDRANKAEQERAQLVIRASKMELLAGVKHEQANKAEQHIKDALFAGNLMRDKAERETARTDKAEKQVNELQLKTKVACSTCQDLSARLEKGECANCQEMSVELQDAKRKKEEWKSQCHSQLVQLEEFAVRLEAATRAKEESSQPKEDGEQ